VQGQLALVLAAAGVAELEEEVDEVILLLPCILLSLVRCTLALCCVVSRCPLSRSSLYLCSLFIGVVLCLAAGDLCFPYRLWAASRG